MFWNRVPLLSQIASTFVAYTNKKQTVMLTLKVPLCVLLICLFNDQELKQATLQSGNSHL